MGLKPRRTKRWITEETVKFLNVDFDLVSPVSLEPLVHALEPVHVLHTVEEPPFRAIMEVEDEDIDLSCEDTIRAFLSRVEALDASTRALWDGCVSRTFDIGLQSGLTPRYVEYHLSPDTVRRLGAAGATIQLTVYGAG